MEHPYVKILMLFAEEICRWVRFPKRTHREGVLRGFWEQIGANFVETLLLQPTPCSAPGAVAFRLGIRYNTAVRRVRLLRGSIKQNR